jgi:hypothetical protein
METKAIIKNVLMLIILSVLISIKVLCSELSGFADLSLDVFIAILLLVIGQQVLSMSVLLPIHLYSKVKKFLKG